MPLAVSRDACVSWFVPPSSTFKASSITSSNLSLTSASITSPPSRTLLLHPSHKNPCDEGHPDSPGSSPHLQILNLVRPAKSLLPREVTHLKFSAVRQVGCRCLWRAVILPNTLVMLFHKTNVVGEADYRLQNRGEMQMALQPVKPQLPCIMRCGGLRVADTCWEWTQKQRPLGLQRSDPPIPRLLPLLPNKHISQFTALLSDWLHFHF